MTIKATCTVLAYLSKLLLLPFHLSDFLVEDDGDMLRLAPTLTADAVLSQVVAHRTVQGSEIL